MLPPGIRHRAVGHNECLQRSVQTGKPSSQQVFWHSGFGFFLSFLHFFPHLINCFFVLHFFILILHFFLSLRPLQSTSGSAGGGGGDGGAEGGSGSHEPQVFLHCFSFASL